jgi:hypothetical protein
MDAGQFPSGCCSQGPAACVPTADVPAGLQSDFATCSGGLCVPDEIIAAGSSFQATTCSSIGNAAGVCLSLCIPEIGNSPDVALLMQGTCITGDVCVPCINPLTGKPTGACSLSVKTCGGDAGADSGPPADAGDGGGGPVCPYTGPPLINPDTFPACSPACSGAHCVPAALVPAADASQLASCTASGGGAGYCAPDTLVESGGEGIPPSCTSIAGAEGRCLSTCLPAVAAQALLLPQATCASDELCVPCYNPTSSDPTTPTGACNLACDKPADPPTILSCPYTGPEIINPDVFGPCTPACGGAHCVPAALVSMAEQSQLATCTDATGGAGFCAPDSLTASAGESVPASCASVAGAEGRCLSVCLPAVAADAEILPQSTCAAGELCAPCYNPTATNPSAPTGACSLACDKPADPPTLLTCPWKGPNVIDPSQLSPCTPACGGAHCLPAQFVPTAEQSELSACTDAAGNAGYCAPDPIIEAGGDYVPPSCDPWPGSGAEGRCLSECLPSVVAQQATLQQSTCSTGQLCAPCYNPFTGAETAACTTSCDSPQNAAYAFPTCCNNGAGALVGTCLPSALVPASEQSELDYSGNGNSSPCPQGGPNYLCVPDEYLPAPYNSLPIQFCQATFLDSCGVCVSQCVNFEGEDVLGSSDCPPNDKAVPCGVADYFATPPPGCYGAGGFCNSGSACGNSCSGPQDCAEPCPNCDVANGSICDNVGVAPEDGGTGTTSSTPTTTSTTTTSTTTTSTTGVTTSTTQTTTSTSQSSTSTSP